MTNIGRSADQVAAQPAGLPLNADAAQTALQRQLAWSQRGHSALSLLLPRATPLAVWAHCPPHDAIAANGRWQFYYHAHPDARVAGEHGHIHVFQRDALARLTHLVALSLDARGNPLAWFTTNLWVTGGRWGSHERLARALPLIDLRLHGGRLRGLAEWLTALLHAYRLALCQLLLLRDATLNAHARQTNLSRRSAMQDRALAVLSQWRMCWPDDALVTQPATAFSPP